MKCPDHGCEMHTTKTQFGDRHACPVNGCTMVSWNAKVPASKPLRMARMKAHAVFDPLWKSGILSRSQAYAWLAAILQKSRDETHFEKMTIEDCEKAVTEVLNIRENLRNEFLRFTKGER